MKHLLTILTGLLVALLFARCADDDNLSGGIDGLPERGIVIRLSTGELDTRTQLTSTGDYHHVKEVWAVLYKWNGNESTDPNDPNNHGNYEFKSATLLKLENGKPWNPYDASTQPRPSKGDDQTDEEYDAALDAYLENMQTNYGGEYGNGKVQGREFVLPETNDMTNGTYRVLCIGLDDKSGAVYDLKKKDGNLNLGSTLAEAKAKMTIETKAYEEQTGTYQMYGYDGTGELFAGWTEFEFEPDNINIAEVELKRRVAGILCYVTDIPAMIENTKVKGIRLCLNTKANGEIGLCRLDKPWEDFGAGGGYSSEYAGGTTLAYQDLSDWKVDGEILTNDEGKNLTMGVYLIPIDVVNDSELGSNFNTLSVQLFGGENYQFNKETGKVTGGEPIKTFNVLNEQGHSTERKETAERYNILPNYIYHIGDKDDDIDEPMSLLGQKITVVPKKWEGGETIPVEFPSVPIYNTMRLVYPTNPDDIKNTDWVGYGDDYVFDCIGVDNIYKPDGYYWDDNYDKLLFLEVDVSVLKEGWSLHIGAPGEDGQMLRFFDDNKYKTDVSRDGQQKEYIPLLMTSYAENDLNKKRRSVTIILTSDGAGKPVNLTVKQDNALIVSMKYGNDDYGVRGFSRRDWHDGETLPWGYSSSSYVPSLIYDYANYKECWCEGNKLYSEAKVNNYDNKFSGSAIYKCAKGFLTLDANGQRDISGHWYLPARRELHSFLKTYPEEAGSTKYWTSTAYVSGKTYCNYVEDIDTGELYDDDIGSTDNIYKPIDRDKSDYTMRAACMIEAPIYD